MRNFKVILKSNYRASGNWPNIEKYEMRKWLVIDIRHEVVISDFSNFKDAQKLARHLNRP